MENFITDLYGLAAFCEYESLKQNRLVFGLRNDTFNEKLQTNSYLTLRQAIQRARKSENVKKQQQGVIRSHLGQVSVENVTVSKLWRPRKKTSSNNLKQTQ